MSFYTNRTQDHASERAVDDFLNRFFYKKLFHKIEPVTDMARQTQGIDIIADNMLIDNKAMTDVQYLNNPANSFVLEICTKDKNDIYQLGWFLNQNNLTDHYLFVWLPNVNVPKGEYLTSSKQINSIEVMLINRNEIHKLINSYISDEELKQKAKYMINNSQERSYIPSSSLKLCYSKHKAEGPITLVVPKFYYKKIAIKHCYVTPTEIIDIK